MFDAFEVIDSVLARNTGQAIERLRRMFAADRDTEYTVVGAFAFHVRRMFAAKAMLEKGASPSDIAGKLRIWSNKDDFFAQLRHISLAQIGEMLQELAGIDYAVKTGQTKATVAVERLVLRLSAIGSRQASG
jgi:DNA polymerase III delta subunit